MVDKFVNCEEFIDLLFKASVGYGEINDKIHLLRHQFDYQKKKQILISLMTKNLFEHEKLNEHMGLSCCFDPDNRTKKNIGVIDNCIGWCYQYFFDDNHNAFIYFQKSLLNECAASYRNLSFLYREGKGCAKDEKKSFELFLQHSTKNDSYSEYSIFDLTVCYLEGKGCPRDEKKGFELLSTLQKTTKNKQLLGEVLSSVGLCYFNGCGCEKDEKKAFLLFKEGAKNGSPASKYNLGCMLLHGKSCDKNEAEAVDLIREAAEHDIFAAQYELGLCYSNAIILKKDEFQASKWIEKSANNGFEEAMKEMVRRYDYGIGIKKDLLKAYRFRKILKDITEKDKIVANEIFRKETTIYFYRNKISHSLFEQHVLIDIIVEFQSFDE